MKPYSAPKIMVHGSINTITKGFKARGNKDEDRSGPIE